MKIFEEAINFTCICEYMKEMKLKNKYQISEETNIYTCNCEYIKKGIIKKFRNNKKKLPAAGFERRLQV
jgi:hypothetical protein